MISQVNERLDMVHSEWYTRVYFKVDKWLL
uniref:Uncharacterized protein n=1 Tax=Arundo donax TaxID=35708 RepID=A0A0A8ZFN5_ARUDO